MSELTDYIHERTLEREAESMYAALVSIRDHDPETCGGVSSDDCLDKVREIARAAIAKAEDRK